jgi:hypothetical protein
VVYCDANLAGVAVMDLASSVVDCRLTSGILIDLNNNLVSYKPKSR